MHVYQKIKLRPLTHEQPLRRALTLNYNMMDATPGETERPDFVFGIGDDEQFDTAAFHGFHLVSQ